MNTFDRMLAGWTEDQWMQGSTNTLRQCVVGRLALAVGLGADLPMAAGTAECQLLQELVKEISGSPYRNVMQWNDTPGRTFEQVRELVRWASECWQDERQINRLRELVA